MQELGAGCKDLDYRGACGLRLSRPVPGRSAEPPENARVCRACEEHEIGIYPTLWSWAFWAHGINELSIGLEKKDEQALALFKDELCTTALRMYEDGADGISTFNWYLHLRNARMPGLEPEPPGKSNAGVDAVLTHIYPLLNDPGGHSALPGCALGRPAGGLSVYLQGRGCAKPLLSAGFTNGLDARSAIRLDQVRTVDRQRLIKAFGGG